MTRPTLIKSADDIYRPLDVQIEERMKPPEPVKDRWFWLRAFGYFTGTLLAGLGVLLGILIVCGFAVVFWGVGKIWRAWK